MRNKKKEICHIYRWIDLNLYNLCTIEFTAVQECDASEAQWIDEPLGQNSSLSSLNRLNKTLRNHLEKLLIFHSKPGIKTYLCRPE